MSTISTQMNWGASYLVNDVYKRFLKPGADDAQLVAASRGASAIVLVLGGAAAWLMIVRGVSVQAAWALLAALGAGVGAVLILRWFWWRINAWSEIAAMVGSAAMYAGFTGWLEAREENLPVSERLPGQYTALIVAGGTLVVWLLVTMLTPAEPRERLVSFFRKIRPDGPGWAPIAAAAPDVRPDGGLGRGVLCAVLGTAVIWLTLPGIGAVIFGEWTKALLCLGGAAASGVAMLRLAPGAAGASTAG